MTMQVIKQLYDIGELFDIASSFENIKKSFNATFVKENGYRDNKFDRNQVLQDTIDMCLNLLQIRLKGFKADKISNYLEDGIKRIDSHLLNDKFSTDSKAKITASKVFAVANLLKNENNFDFNSELFQNENIRELANINLSKPFNMLNRLKPVLPEAFYYIWRGIKE